MDRRDKINVGRMKRCRIGVVQKEHIVFVDMTLEAPDNRLTGLGGAGQMMEESDATH